MTNSSISRGLVAVCCLLLALPAMAADVPSKEDQIAAAVLAGPEGRRAGAAVIGWTADGKPVNLRDGSNELVCLSDNPTDDQFSVACYHEDLEPYMTRGRELSLAGVKGPARRAPRFAEVEAGKVAMPKEPRTLYVLHGSGYNAESGEVDGAYLRWVVYTPYATPESTGLSIAPAESAPWLMDPGTPGAHIMINPPRPE